MIDGQTKSVHGCLVAVNWTNLNDQRSCLFVQAMANGQRLTAAINRGNENSFNQPSKTKLMAVWPFVLVLSQVDDEFSIRRLIAKRYNRWTINELSMRVWTTIVQHQVMYQLMIDGTNVPRNDRWY